MNDVLEEIETYRRTYAVTARAHYLRAARMRRRHLYFGVPSTAVSAIAGTTIFSTMEQNPSEDWRVLAGVVLLVVAVLSALQTFFRFSEAAEKSLAAARRNSDLRRKLAYLLLKYADDETANRAHALQELEGLLAVFTEVAEQSPTIPDDLYSKAATEFDAGDGNA